MLLPRGRGGGGGTWVNFCLVFAAGLPEPIPHYSILGVNYRPHLSHFWANIKFSRFHFSHILFIYHLILNEQHFTSHRLQYNHSGTFTNRKCEELSYPKNQKMFESSRENATPSSGTPPLASYKEVPPPHPNRGTSNLQASTIDRE